MHKRTRRQESWDLLRQIAAKDTLPWCVFRDFNDLLYVSDKEGMHPHSQSLMDGFRMTIEDCNLVEVDLTGGKYTWEKSKGKPNWVKERLDRAFATEVWW